jgi:hypothetical protein
MNLYSTILLYTLIVAIVLGIVYWVYVRYFQPIPGDTTSVTSQVFRKQTPVFTNAKSQIATNVSMTENGAFSFLFTLEENSVDTSKTNNPSYALSPILTISPQGGNPTVQIVVNRVTSELCLQTFDSDRNDYIVPIATAGFRKKTSIVIQFLPNTEHTMFFVNVFLNGRFILSRGIPKDYGLYGSNVYQIETGDNQGVMGNIQTIRVWEDARTLRNEDFVKISEDPLRTD